MMMREKVKKNKQLNRLAALPEIPRLQHALVMAPQSTDLGLPLELELKPPLILQSCKSQQPLIVKPTRPLIVHTFRPHCKTKRHNVFYIRLHIGWDDSVSENCVLILDEWSVSNRL